MAKFVYATVILLLLGVVMIQAQICRPYTMTMRPGQRICIRNCPPRPSPCITAIRVKKIQLCPPGCCRTGSGCQSLRKG
ncbi:uncharacterized protein LOC105213754 isoform X3 [Zeugodacus cucurbitae]|uniref:uncharacterized protein LOC105213754 isoform X3 n=1 Tax=Zeugodacus cucurbitae TaxID=28588 RepID=UPI000596A731|nr:uncharacterized protein LOC105213754 isoform X3 [Zeugodacus cucurbitae]